MYSGCLKWTMTIISDTERLLRLIFLLTIIIARLPTRMRTKYNRHSNSYEWHWLKDNLYLWSFKNNKFCSNEMFNYTVSLINCFPFSFLIINEFARLRSINCLSAIASCQDRGKWWHQRCYLGNGLYIIYVYIYIYIYI